MAALRISQGFRLAVFLAVPFVTASAVPGQSYGLGEQVLTLGPASFVPYESDLGFGRGNVSGYFLGSGEYAAPLSLPNGAEILEMCVYGFIPEPPSLVFLTARIRTTRLAFGGQAPEVADVAGSEVLDIIPGYERSCTAPLSYVFSDTTGSGEHISHEIFLQLSTGSALGGIRITWRRQVSPPPGTPTFGDVPPSDPAFPFIEALVASEITAGCGSGNYCPDAALTRRQMAVFLAKALGLHWPN
jgi:hypothetical protein